MEIVVHSKKSLFQQKFQKKLYHFNRNSQFRSVMCMIRLPVLLGIRDRLQLHPKTSDSLRLRLPTLNETHVTYRLAMIHFACSSRQGWAARIQISSSSSRHLKFLALAPKSRRFRLQLQNNLVHWKLKSVEIFLQVVFPSNYGCGAGTQI